MILFFISLGAGTAALIAAELQSSFRRRGRQSLSSASYDRYDLNQILHSVGAASPTAAAVISRSVSFDEASSSAAGDQSLGSVATVSIPASPTAGIANSGLFSFDTVDDDSYDDGSITTTSAANSTAPKLSEAVTATMTAAEAAEEQNRAETGRERESAARPYDMYDGLQTKSVVGPESELMIVSEVGPIVGPVVSTGATAVAIEREEPKGVATAVKGLQGSAPCGGVGVSPVSVSASDVDVDADLTGAYDVKAICFATPPVVTGTYLPPGREHR